MLDFKPEKRPKIVEICESLIKTKFFSINFLNIQNCQELLL